MSAIQSIEQSYTVVGVDVSADMDQYLTFILADEEYGVDILRVQEIKGWGSVTPIPNTPEFIKGVINLRGTIVPIIDLRQRFGLKKMEYGKLTVVIVLKVVCEVGERVMGIIVDAVSDVYNVAEEEMKPPPDFGSVVSIDYVKGLATVGEKMVIVLDIDHLLTSSVYDSIDNSAK
ncbi:MAG: purine-binding chemotaxis protein CheW [Gammaproteobacteria bacterium]|nr:purine-binding chemotaxis protein CheW [Gammaproteobacteria bacterium]